MLRIQYDEFYASSEVTSCKPVSAAWNLAES